MESTRLCMNRIQPWNNPKSGPMRQAIRFTYIDRLLPTLMFCCLLHSHFSSLKFILFLNQPNTWTPSQYFVHDDGIQAVIDPMHSCYLCFNTERSKCAFSHPGTITKIPIKQFCHMEAPFLESVFSNILAMNSIVPPAKWPVLLSSRLQ